MRTLDRDTAERLMDGLITPDDAPPGYGVAARVIAVLRAPERAGDDPRNAPIVVGAGRTVTRARPVSRGRRVPRRQLAAAAIMLSGILTASLASAGALPAPVQGIAASVLDRVGIHVPAPATASRHLDG